MKPEAGQGGERPRHRSTGTSQRFGDTKLAFGMKLYEHGSGKGDELWIFSVQEYCGGKPLIRIEASECALREMRNFIDNALKMIAPPPPSENTEP